MCEGEGDVWCSWTVNITREIHILGAVKRDEDGCIDISRYPRLHTVHIP